MIDLNEIKIVVVIPIHNEGKVIEVLYKSIQRYLLETSGLTFILALDNCTDDTKNILLRIRNNPNILVYEGVADKGYGNIVRLAFIRAQELGFDWALVMDSDLSSPLTEISKVRKLVSVNLNPKIVIIKGNRFSRFKPNFVGVPFERTILSKSANLFTRLFGSGNSEDLTNGFRAVNLAWFATQTFKESGFSSILEEAYLVILGGNRILDFPTELRYDQAIRIESSFTFDNQLIRSYIQYVVKIWKISIKRKIQSLI